MKINLQSSLTELARKAKFPPQYSFPTAEEQKLLREKFGLPDLETNETNDLLKKLHHRFFEKGIPLRAIEMVTDEENPNVLIFRVKTEFIEEVKANYEAFNASI